MWKVLGAIVLAGVAIAAIKVALVILVLAALIFRPKETLGLLALGALLHLWHYSTLAGAGLTAVLVLLAVYAAKQPAEPD